MKNIPFIVILYFIVSKTGLFVVGSLSSSVGLDGPDKRYLEIEFYYHLKTIQKNIISVPLGVLSIVQQYNILIPLLN